MFIPPGDWQRQKSSNQLLDRGQGQYGGIGARARGKMRAGNRNVPILPRG